MGAAEIAPFLDVLDLRSRLGGLRDQLGAEARSRPAGLREMMPHPIERFAGLGKAQREDIAVAKAGAALERRLRESADPDRNNALGARQDAASVDAVE